MSWQDQINGDSLTWLLEADNPDVRYLAMRDLLQLAEEDVEYQSARELAHREGLIGAVLAEMQPEGYWVEPGPGYNPKYRSTVWAIILLAQLGASIADDARIELACKYVLEHALTENGQFTTSGSPSGTADCLQGNLSAALLELGCTDARLDNAIEWMARSTTGEGVAPLGDKQSALRYYAGKRGPLFMCGANNNMACAWGGTKVMLAFSKLPAEKRTALVEAAIRQGVDFFLDVDPATASYPNGWADKPSGNWWKFGFPVFYVTDVLQIVESLVGLGYGNDPRLTHAAQLILEKQDAQGRWVLEYDYAGKTWVEFGRKKEPNKWVTLRAARVLKAIWG
ncbi:MAG: nitrogen fixation protein NifH [Chloroflexi bacterium HGW-Chloroflexi-10]|nr:MAG: nitrogen fixation protein NifH [Chloroflexi bacterium HGW-Chloroflexi-10]